MVDWRSAWPSVLDSFMASMVIFVEVRTVVFAVGVVRGWRSALLGAASGATLLAALVLVLSRLCTASRCRPCSAWSAYCL